MCERSDRLHVAYIPSANPCGEGNFLAHVNMPSFRQICRTLVLASGTHVVERPLLKIRLKFQRDPNANEFVPSPPGVMVIEYELQGLLVGKCIFDTMDSVPALERR